MYKMIKITPETHKLLEEAKVEIISKLKNPNLSFDDCIKELIKFYREHSKEK